VTNTDHSDLIERVLVIGAGTMGGGIAQVVAEAGIETILTDTNPAALETGLSTIAARWDRNVASGKRTAAETEEFRECLRSGTIADVPSGDLVIEAIIEDYQAKSTLLAEISPMIGRAAILASNTSSLSITALGNASGHPDRFFGLHFFNPVPVLPLVEVVRGLETSATTLATATAFVARIGKTPVTVSDAPGFIANRILLPMINEAIFALQENVATRDAIDAVMKLGMSHPLGPLALADLIGLDVCLAILETLHRDFGDDKYRPAPLLRRMVAAGHLGRKTGRGFYDY
jgi:3-hydroxybutyryl-CoA dehydrogenase